VALSALSQFRAIVIVTSFASSGGERSSGTATKAGMVEKAFAAE
jgi:hypothetical protein